MARQRNNITKLPIAIRGRIAELLADGASYDEVRGDTDVSAACEEKELQLHSSTFGAWIQSAEYKEYLSKSMLYGADIERRKMASYLVSNSDAASDIARVANYELLKIILAKLESGEDLEASEIRGISGGLAAYERNRIASENAADKRTADKREIELQAKIAALEASVRAAEAKVEKLKDAAGAMDGKMVAEAMNAAFGVNKQ